MLAYIEGGFILIQYLPNISVPDIVNKGSGKVWYDRFYILLIFVVICKLMYAIVNNEYNFLFYIPLGKDMENLSLSEIGQWLICEMEVIHEGMSGRKKRTQRIKIKS